MEIELLSVRKTAQLLCLSESQVRKLIATRVLPCVKLGRSVRVRASDVETLVRQGLPLKVTPPTSAT